MHRNELTLDSEKSFSFLQQWAGPEQQFEAKWVDNTITSFLILSDRGALVEGYELGAKPSHKKGFGCMARSSPVMFAKPGSDFFHILEASFDFVFNQPEEGPVLKIYTAEQMESEFGDDSGRVGGE